MSDVISFQPGAHIFRKSAAAGIVDGKSFSHICVRRKLGNRCQALPEAASSMGAEGYDLFSGEIIFLQKGRNRHWDGRPPVRITQKDRFILIHILQMLRDFRACLVVLVMLCLHQ